MAFYCSQCRNYNPKNTNSYGQGYCSGWSTYVEPDKIANSCRKFCYIVTKVESILKINENNPILTNNQELRLSVMDHDVNYYDFIEDYDNFGPTLASDLENDSNKEYVASYVYDNCLVPVSKLLEEEKLNEAAALYMNMFYGLAAYYNIKIEDKPLARTKKDE